MIVMAVSVKKLNAEHLTSNSLSSGRAECGKWANGE
jgi:hypothetical protein